MKVCINRVEVYAPIDSGILQDRPCLRGKPERSASARIEERLLAKSVAGEKERVVSEIANGKREHPP